MSLLLNGIKFMVIGGDEGNLQMFPQGQRKGIGKGDALCNFYDTDPLDECIISISTECERQLQGVCPGSLGCYEPVGTEKVVVHFAKIADVHGQEGIRTLNALFEHFSP